MNENKNKKKNNCRLTNNNSRITNKKSIIVSHAHFQYFLVISFPLFIQFENTKKENKRNSKPQQNGNNVCSTVYDDGPNIFLFPHLREKNS